MTLPVEHVQTFDAVAVHVGDPNALLAAVLMPCYEGMTDLAFKVAERAGVDPHKALAMFHALMLSDDGTIARTPPLVLDATDDEPAAPAPLTSTPSPSPPGES